MREYDMMNDGEFPPSPECTLPEPIRPEGDAGIMVTADCPHCGTKFLLVQRMTSEDWIEAEAWWDYCRRNEDYHYQETYEPRLTEYYRYELPYLEDETYFDTIFHIRKDEK